MTTTTTTTIRLLKRVADASAECGWRAGNLLDGLSGEGGGVPVFEGGKRRFSLMQEDCITLRFSLPSPVAAETGTLAADPRFGIFAVTERQWPSCNAATGGYDYELKLEAQYRLWKNRQMKLCYLREDGRTWFRDEQEWSLTDTISNHAAILLANAHATGLRYIESVGDDGVPQLRDWTVEADPAYVRTEEIKNVRYAQADLLSALSEIAQAWECEWWFDGPVLRFGKCEREPGEGAELPRLEMHESVSAMTRSQGERQYANRIYPFGGTGNVPETYRKQAVFTVTAARLDEEYAASTGRAGCVALLTDKPLRAGYFAAPLRERHAFSWEGVNPSQDLTGQGGMPSPSAPPTTFSRRFTVGRAGRYAMVLSGFRLRAFLPDYGTDTPAVGQEPSGYREAGGFSPSDTLLVDIRPGAGGGELLSALYGAAGGAELRYGDEMGRLEVSADLPAGECVLRITPAIADLPPGSRGYVLLSAEARLESEAYAGDIVEGEPVGGFPTEQLAGGALLEWTDGSVSGALVNSMLQQPSTPRGKELTLTTSPVADPADLVGRRFTIREGMGLNMPLSYFDSDDASLSAAVKLAQAETRLRLPDGVPPYIDVPREGASAVEDWEAVEATLVLDDIFPRQRQTAEVARVDEEHEDGKTVTEHADGTQTVSYVPVYTLRAAAGEGYFDFSEQYLLSGQELRVRFELGAALGGMEFQARFNPDGKPEKNADGTWNPEAQLFQLIPNTDYGRLLPDAVHRPSDGDPFILTGFNSEAITAMGLVGAAEQELLDEATRQARRMAADDGTYSCTLRHGFLLELMGGGLVTRDPFMLATSDRLRFTPRGLEGSGDESMPLREGDPVLLLNPAYFPTGGRRSRVVGYEFPLDIPFDNPVFEVGESVRYSRLRDIERKLRER